MVVMGHKTHRDGDKNQTLTIDGRRKFVPQRATPAVKESGMELSDVYMDLEDAVQDTPWTVAVWKTMFVSLYNESTGDVVEMEMAENGIISVRSSMTGPIGTFGADAALDSRAFENGLTDAVEAVAEYVEPDVPTPFTILNRVASEGRGGQIRQETETEAEWCFDGDDDQYVLTVFLNREDRDIPDYTAVLHADEPNFEEGVFVPVAKGGVTSEDIEDLVESFYESADHLRTMAEMRQDTVRI